MVLHDGISLSVEQTLHDSSQLYEALYRFDVTYKALHSGSYYTPCRIIQCHFFFTLELQCTQKEELKNELTCSDMMIKNKIKKKLVFKEDWKSVGDDIKNAILRDIRENYIKCRFLKINNLKGKRISEIKMIESE